MLIANIMSAVAASILFVTAGFSIPAAAKSVRMRWAVIFYILGGVLLLASIMRRG